MIELLQSITQIPYFWLAYTCLVFIGFEVLSIKFKRSVLTSPILWSMVVIVLSLKLTKINYTQYAEQVGLLSLFLSLTIVAFAVPLYENKHIISKNWRIILSTLLMTNILSLIPTLLFVFYLPVELDVAIPLLSKTATSPISMAISSALHTNIALAAVFSILTGLSVAFFGPLILKILNVTDKKTRGFAMGVAGHGIATAQIVNEGELVVSFAALGLILNGLLTAVMMPVVLEVFY